MIDEERCFECNYLGTRGGWGLYSLAVSCSINNFAIAEFLKAMVLKETISILNKVWYPLEKTLPFC